MIIDTDKLVVWAKIHLKIVMTVGLFIAAWYAANLANRQGFGDCLIMFYGTTAVGFMVLGFVCLINILKDIFGWNWDHP
jgi:hypothetical protein